MHHKLHLSTKEKLDAWLQLCDLSFKLLKDNIDKKEIKNRLNKMREDHLRIDYSILKGLSRLK